MRNIFKKPLIMIFISCFMIMSPMVKADAALNTSKSLESVCSANRNIDNSNDTIGVSNNGQGNIPHNTIIIGDKAYDIRSLFNTDNYNEIKEAVSNPVNNILFNLNGANNGEWQDLNKNIIDPSSIPQVDYIDQYGDIITYGKGDGTVINAVYNIIKFEDPNLESVIRDVINKPMGDILKSDISKISVLDASGKEIKSLNGIENLNNLTSLNLNNNQISDISLLKGLNKLTNINLYHSLNLTQQQIDDLKTSLPNCNIEYSRSVAGIELDLKQASLTVNGTIQLGAYVLPTDATDKNIKCSSSDPAVVEVVDNTVMLDNNGKATGKVLLKLKGLKTGTANITVNAEDGNKQAICKVNVFEDSIVNFEDVNLANCVRNVLNKASGESILKSDVDTIYSLDISEKNIISLKGIENLNNLTELNLYYNQISDLSLLSYLTNLSKLRLDSNKINNLSGLNGLVNLTQLSLFNNQISDLSPLSNLTNLTNLDLGQNKISDISSLKDLTNLTILDLWSNQVNNISVLSGLTNLSELYLLGNQISDVSSLRGLTKLTYLTLGNNQIKDISALSGLTNLIYLDVGWNKISDISSLSGLTNLIVVWLERDQISNINSLSCLKKLIYLHLDENQISDINALGGLTDLGYLTLSYNQIKDISSLSHLTNLISLDLNNNQIYNVNPLSGLLNLDHLWLNNNQISEISALGNLSNLTYFNLSQNPISDINVIGGLTNLDYIWLNSTQINDINALKGLNKLEYVDLSSNLNLTQQQIDDLKADLPNCNIVH